MKNVHEKIGGHFKNQQTEDEFLDTVKKLGNRIEANKKGMSKAVRVATAMDKKASIKGGIKGALIGGAVAAPLAYAANKALKNKNEKTNKSRQDEKE